MKRESPRVRKAGGRLKDERVDVEAESREEGDRGVVWKGEKGRATG